MSDANPEQVDLNTQPPDEVETEAGSLAVDDGKGNKMVPLSALIGAKKEAREAQKKVKELEPTAARAAEIEAQLGKAQPLIDALIASPKLRAEAIRIVQGTNKTPESVTQPEDDPEARETAEDLGLYLADGVTPDVKRAQRIMQRWDTRTRRQTEEAIRPIAGVVAGSRADSNIQRAIQATDANGVPYATPESIREVAAKLPPHLLADDNVVNIVLRAAIGEDRMQNRSPKAAEEPLFLSTAGGRTRRAEPTISADERATIARLGLTEKEYTESVNRLTSSNGRSIVLGK